MDKLVTWWKAYNYIFFPHCRIIPLSSLLSLAVSLSNTWIYLHGFCVLHLFTFLNSWRWHFSIAEHFSVTSHKLNLSPHFWPSVNIYTLMRWIYFWKQMKIWVILLLFYFVSTCWCYIISVFPFLIIKN